MAEAIRDGTGTIGENAKVGSDNRLWVRTEGPWNGIGSLDLQTALINDASGTAVQIVAGVANSNINVYAYKLICGSTLSFAWLDQTIAMEGSQFCVANGVIVEGINPPNYLFRAGTGSDLQLSTTGNVGGRVSYFVL